MQILKRSFLGVVIILAVLAGAAMVHAGGGKWNVSGTYVEGCSCNPPCACELTGLESGCQGVGAMALDGGSYQGTNLAGTKIAYATIPGQWVRLYVDAPNERQRQAATAFGKMAFKDFGRIDKVSPAKISLAGKNGTYTMTVDDGKIMSLTTEPMLGGDNKTPMVYSNVKNPLISTFMQAKTISGKYSDGGKSFELKSTNSYFNTHMKSSGSL